MKKLSGFAIVAVTLVLRAAFAATDATLEQSFPFEADVIASGGPATLDLTDDVVAACRPDLSDLRLFDAAGHEIPFAFDTSAPLTAGTSVPQILDGKLLDVDRQEIGREHGPALRREIYEIAVPEDAPASGSWKLDIGSPHGHFVRQVRVDAVSVDAEPVTLIRDESVFRLATPQESKTSLDLPSFVAPRLRVTLEGEEDFFLEPRFTFRSERQLEPQPPIIVPLEQVTTHSSTGRTFLTVARPSGIVPTRMRVDSTTSWFDRPVEIFDLRQGFADRLIGSGRIKRNENTKEPDDREIAVARAEGQQLRVVIEEGDSPPLAHLRLVAVATRPRLIFVVPAGNEKGRVATLRFGGGGVPNPQYDIAKPGSLTGPDGKAIVVAELPAARLTSIRSNPSFQPAPSLEFAMHRGATVDERLFTHERTIIANPSTEGLSRISLEPEDLAVLRPDLADVRIVDSEHHQWPYLINRNTRPEEIALTLSEVAHERGHSRYVFTPPAQPMEVAQVLIDTDAQFLDRRYQLTATREDGESRTLSTGKLNRGPGDPTPPTIRFAPQRVESLELKIVNGDDSPIELQGARTSVELPEIFLVAPTGHYTLLLGYPDADPARYEIAQARDAILTAPANDATTSELRPNPEFSQRARFATGTTLRTMPQVLLWIALLLAVVVLGIVTARIVRSEAPRQA